MTSPPDSSPEKEIIKTFEAAGVVEYLEYLQSGKRLMWTNFRAGVAKGLGITIGATVVLAILVWILAKLVALPVIGEYFSQAEVMVEEYVEGSNYKEDFAEMNRLLREIRENTAD